MNHGSPGSIDHQPSRGRRVRRESQEEAPIPRLPRQESYALSPYQRGIWTLVQANPGNPFYNASRIFKLSGPLDLRHLQRAFQALFDRHDVLRASFAATPSGPVQRIAPRVEVDLPLVDLSSLPEARRAAPLHRWIEETAWSPFDLGVAPLLRFRLFRFAAADHRLVLTAHHIISDGASGKLMLEELALLYAALSTGADLPAPPALQYQDFSHWQNERLAAGALADSESYWLRRLGGELPAWELPADRRRPPVPSYRGAQHRRLLSAELTGRLKRLRREAGTTTFRVALAAFDTLLCRMSGETDVIVGSPVSGRTHPGLRDVQGLFVNMLALRADLGGDPPFTAVLGQIKESTREDIEHKDFPFDALVRRLNPRRTPGRSPIFDVVLVMREPTFASELRAGRLTLSQDEAPLTRIARYDLTLGVAETPLGLRFTFEYSTDLFDGSTVARLAGSLECLLAGLVEAPAERISHLPLLTAAERAALLLEWNDTERPPASVGSLLCQIEAQAERQPDAVALACGERALSARELIAEIGRMARRWIDLGLRPGEVVGVAIERSELLVPALLAIWKAGGTYLPMDPSYPRSRLEFMLEDAGCRMVLVDESTPTELVLRAPVVVRLDGGGPGGGEPAPAALPTPPLVPAYILYTSGSTGRPKAVAVPHEALSNFLMAMAERLGLAAGDALLAVTSLSFDIAALELYLPLLLGVRLELASREESGDGARLLRRLQESAATVMQATPSSWRLLIGAGWQGEPRLAALCGGEALSGTLAAELHARAAAVWNLYGPTETTVWSAVGRSLSGAAVTLGSPIANTTLYVLDPGLEPVPVGVSGELAIGGAGVALGYRRRPDLTAERFLPDPWSRQPGARLYRTGDLVRWRARGDLEFLGRLDRQVKVRGVRVEPGEVEAALEALPQVAQAVVVAQAAPEGGGRLVAYVVPRPAGAPLAVAALRARLQRTLPEALIPAAWVVLAELPLTPNGKVDRSALAGSGAAAGGAAAAYVPPRDAAEWELAELWEQILGFRGIGVFDNFFEIGGNSLLAVSLAGEIERRLGIPLPAAALSQVPTIAGMATLLSLPEHAARFSGNLVPIRPGDRSEPPLVLVHAHRGGIFTYHALARTLGGKYPIYGLQALGLAAGEEPLDSIRHMAALYLEQLRALQPRGPYRLAGWSFGGIVAYEMARQLESAGEELALLALIDASPPDDLPEESLVGDGLPSIGRAFFGLEEADLAELDEESALALLLTRGRDLGLLPAGMTAAAVGRLIRVVIAHTRALAGYRATSRIQSDICLLRAATDSRVRDPAGWRRRTVGSFSVVTVPGSHHEMVYPPAVDKLAAALNEALDRAALPFALAGLAGRLP
jgi:amino acid adenylation domain-containing protein